MTAACDDNEDSTMTKRTKKTRKTRTGVDCNTGMLTVTVIPYSNIKLAIV